MLHQPSGGTRGQASDILIHAEEIIKRAFLPAPSTAVSGPARKEHATALALRVALAAGLK